MYGHKEVLTCMVIVTVVAILNCYRSIMKRDKEIQDYRRSILEQEKLELEAERVALQHEIFVKKMLEYSDHCYDVHALIYRPRDYDLEKKSILDMNATRINYNEDNVGENKFEVDGNNLHGSDKNRFVVTKGKENDINGRTNQKADTSSIVYVLVAILLGSLIRAALDLTRHYKKKDNNETENDILRRCSLQEYSLLKHKQKKLSKGTALESCSTKSISSQRSLDSSTKVTLQQHDRLYGLSGNPQDYSNGSGIITEAGTPPRPGK